MRLVPELLCDLYQAVTWVDKVEVIPVRVRGDSIFSKKDKEQGPKAEEWTSV